MSRVLRALFPLLLLSLLAVAQAGPRDKPPALTVRLPADITYDQAEDAPDVVVFSHELHVGFVDKCLACHPQPFRMLQPARRALHSEMDAGRSCGSCHDGASAFATADGDACERCHAGGGGP